jgi:hypothetical protein
MNEKIKEEWLKRLRSGMYKQGTKQLHSITDDTYCCLGVLCEIALEQGICKKVDGRYDNSDTILPYSVQEWAELESPNPEVRYSPNSVKTLSLAQLNDGSDSLLLSTADDGVDTVKKLDYEQHSFSQIANLIEKYL